MADTPTTATPLAATPTACPRCGSSIADEDFYGVCAACREQLRVAFAGEARAVEAVEYEPKVNVTPNAVATKD